MRPGLHGTEPSIGELFGELAGETSQLVRQEVSLVAAELAQKARYAAKQASYVAIGGYVGLIAVQALLAAAVLGLGMVMPLWAAALAVGGFAVVVAAVVAMKGIEALRHMDPSPTQTMLSLEENKSWIKKQMQ